MSKHDVLAANEVDSYAPHPEIVRYAVEARTDETKGLKNLRILDWGCGRGRLVAYLLDRDADAFSVDIDPNTVAKAQDYFCSQGWDAAHHLRPLSKKSKTDFPDGYFDVIISDNVLEYVADLDSVMSEMARLTRPGGRNYHLFPARFTLFEGHLHKPLVHWLPKNRLRRRLIGLFTACGVEPNWRELDKLDRSQKAEIYFQYSCDKTFYRAPNDILQTCARHGFISHLAAGDHPRIQRVLGAWGAQSSTIRNFANKIMSELKTMELYVEKPAMGERAGSS